MRPIILTAIEEVATRGDLASRTLPIVLEIIPDDHRKPENEFWAAFSAAHAAILGGLLDTIVVGLRALPSVKLDRLPRMADFAVWACACDGGRTGEGSFIAAYAKNRENAIAVVVQEDTVASAVLAFMKGKTEWVGSTTVLLAALNSIVDDAAKTMKEWPKAPNALSRRLTRLAAVLRKSGVAVVRDRDMRARELRLCRIAVPDNAHRTIVIIVIIRNAFPRCRT
jgi:hypothetical protein